MTWRSIVATVWLTGLGFVLLSFIGLLVWANWNTARSLIVGLVTSAIVGGIAFGVIWLTITCLVWLEEP